MNKSNKVDKNKFPSWNQEQKPANENAAQCVKKDESKSIRPISLRSIHNPNISNQNIYTSKNVIS